jgi:phosphoglycerate dehydrogenase-like enzyme
MVRGVFLSNDQARLFSVFDEKRRARLAEIADMHPVVVGLENIDREAGAGHLESVEVAFSTWGMPCLAAVHLARLPRFKALFYAAGSVRDFAEPLLERGVRLFSAAAANAIPVAEFAFSQIVLSCKGYFRNTRDCSDAQRFLSRNVFWGRGCYGESVSLLGAGAVARRLIQLLSQVELRVLVYDPYLEAADAAELGVEKVALDEAFARGYVVSNHVPNISETVGILNRGLFEQMRRDATFINTGRGATVVEADLISVQRERPDLTALLDVTWPDPPTPDSPLYALPNVQLSSHIAGSKADEYHRLADAAIEACGAWLAGREFPGEVTAQMLSRLA